MKNWFIPSFYFSLAAYDDAEIDRAPYCIVPQTVVRGGAFSRCLAPLVQHGFQCITPQITQK
jgi:hypothetical protein